MQDQNFNQPNNENYQNPNDQSQNANNGFYGRPNNQYYNPNINPGYNQNKKVFAATPNNQNLNLAPKQISPINSQPIIGDFSIGNVDITVPKASTLDPVSIKKSGFSVGFLKPNTTAIFSGSRGKKILLGLTIFLSVLTIFGIFAGLNYFGNKNEIKYNDVVSTIEIPNQIAQGSPTKFVLNITNNNPVPIENISVIMDFDEDYQFVRGLNNITPTSLKGNSYNLGKIDAKETGANKSIIAFEGVLSGIIDKEAFFGGRISYTSNQKIYEQPIGKVKTLITSPDVKITFESKDQNVQNGGEAEFIVKIKNVKEKEISDLQLKLDYPGGNAFNYISSDFTSNIATQNKTTPDNGDNIWYIPKLPGLGEQTLILRGKVTTKDNQRISFGANLNLKTAEGSYQNIAKTFKDINITVEPISIKTYINSNNQLSTFAPDERLNFVIEYSNQSQNIIKDAQILGSVDDASGLLDLNSIEFTGGSRAFLSNSQIQWIGNNTPQLATINPSTRGKLEYSIKVKKDIIKPTLKQSDYTLRPQVKITASNLQEIFTTGPLYKMSSNISFVQKVEKIKPETETQQNRERFRVNWKINTQQNEVDNLIVKTRTSLPASSWQSKSISPFEQSKNINYNSGNGDIQWKVDKIPAYSGLDSSKAFEISFELEFETQPNQREQQLVEAIQISAKDNYTGQGFSLQNEAAIGKANQ
jgi:hypothetical protein